MTTHLVLLLGGWLMSVAPPNDVAIDAKRPFVVSLRVTPAVGEPGKAPRLEVTVHNPTTAPLPFMDAAPPQCFVYFHLSLKLSTPKGDAGAPKACSLLSWPGVVTLIKPGGAYQKQLPLGELFPANRWKAGAYELDVTWQPDGLQRYRNGEYALGAASQSLSGERFTLAQALTKLRIQRGATVTLPDGARLKFSAHGHKMVGPQSPPGPLIVHGTFTAPGKATAAEFDVHVYPATNPIMRLQGGYTFELLDHEYDSFMELRYFGALKSTDSSN